jgi:hypothetical protein
LFKICTELSNFDINKEIKVKEKRDVESKIFVFNGDASQVYIKRLQWCVLLYKYEMFQHWLKKLRIFFD